MVITYTITTPMMHDARTQAMNRAKAEGWRRVTITALNRLDANSYLVTLVVTR